MLALLDPTSLVASSGYLAIFLLSVLQSCCIPTSSELVMGFGGVLASQGKLSLAGVIAAGVAGEVVGAYIAYFIGRTGGRTLVDRYGRYVLLTNQDLDRAEAWYQRHGRWGVFGSRLVPVIRNFVAVPAGVAEVPLVRFGVMTFLGSLIWDGAWPRSATSWVELEVDRPRLQRRWLPAVCAGGDSGGAVLRAPVAVLQGGQCFGEDWRRPAGPRRPLCRRPGVRRTGDGTVGRTCRPPVTAGPAVWG